jgi:hypothetical protein
MAMQIPTKPDAFFGTFVPEMFAEATTGRELPPIPYVVSVRLADAERYTYRVENGELIYQTGDAAPTGDIDVSLSEEDFSELVRAARSNAPDELPEPPHVAPTYRFPDIATLKGSLRVIVDDLGDKRTVDVRLGDVPADEKPKAVIHTTVDFVVGLQGKTLAVEQILRAGGVKVEGDFGYVLRVANAMTGKARRRER